MAAMRVAEWSEQQQCETAYHLSQSSMLRIVILTKAVFSALGLVAISAFLRRRGVSFLIHPYTKLVFLIHVVATFACTSCYLLCFVIDLIRYSRNHLDPCEYTLPFPLAFWLRFFAVFFIIVQIASGQAMAWDSLYAAIHPVKYERMNRPHTKVALATVLIVAPVILTVCTLAVGIEWPARAASFTVRTIDNSFGYQVLTSSEVGLELLTLVIFHIALIINFRQKINTAHYVANRFQLISNTQNISYILPIIWTHFATTIVTSASLSLYPLLISSDTVTHHTIFLELVAIGPLYAFALAATLSVRLRQTEQTLAASAQLNRARPTLQMDEHFRTLQTLFDKPRPSASSRLLHPSLRRLARLVCCCGGATGAQWRLDENALRR